MFKVEEFFLEKVLGVMLEFFEQTDNFSKIK